MVVLVGFLAGCNVGEFEWEAVESDDLGSLCLMTAPPDSDIGAAQAFTADTPIRAVVGRCFSGGCAKDVQVVVEAVDDRPTLVLGSAWSWERAILREGQGCTSDCNMQFGETDLGTLPEGTYTVRYGDQSVQLVIPSTERVCLGGDPFGVDAEP